MNKCYKIVWLFMNMIISCGEMLTLLRLRIATFLLWSQYLFRKAGVYQQTDIAFLKDLKQQLAKIPKHLSLIIGSENKEFNEDALKRILRYATVMDIQYISLYDTRRSTTCTNGHSISQKNDKSELGKEIFYKTIDQGNATYNDVHYGKNGYSKEYAKQTVESQQLGEKCVKVYYIQTIHGRRLLASICRKLFSLRTHMGMQDILQERDNLSERISEELKLHLSHLCEPEVSIIFSNCFCTYGFLPWHTRFTEFHRCKIGHSFDVKTFAYILHQYANCHQRRGK